MDVTERFITYRSTHHGSHLIDAISELRKNKEFCDVLLLVGGKSIAAHRLILSACSPYFHGYFERRTRHVKHEPEDGSMNADSIVERDGQAWVQINLPGVDEQAAEMIVDYCYTSSIVISNTSVWSLFPAVSLLQLEELQNVCCDYMVDMLDMTTCMNVRALAAECNSGRLLAYCDDFIKDHLQELFSSDTFHDLSLIETILHMSQLSSTLLSNDQVFHGIRSWLTSDVSRAHFIPTLLQQIPCLRENYKAEDFGIDTSLAQRDTGNDLAVPEDLPSLHRCTVCNILLPCQENLQMHMSYHNKHSLEEQKINSSMKNDQTLQSGISTENNSADMNNSLACVSSGDPLIETFHEFICNICGKSFQNNVELTNHCLLHIDNASGNHTGNTFTNGLNMLAKTNASNVQLALSVDHTNVPKTLTSDETVFEYKTEKKYVCRLCGVQQENAQDIYSHCMVHVRAQHPSPRCKVCEKETGGTHEKLAAHYVWHSTDIVFLCPLCDKQTRTKFNLQVHMRLHTGALPFTCEICGKSFRNSCVMKVHRQTHLGEKPFQCGECQHSFVKKIHLKRHEHLHSGQKPFICDVCGKDFTRKDHRDRHIKTLHTMERPHGCNVCGKNFVRRYELSRHLKNHVPKKDIGTVSENTGVSFGAVAEDSFISNPVPTDTCSGENNNTDSNQDVVKTRKKRKENSEGKDDLVSGLNIQQLQQNGSAIEKDSQVNDVNGTSGANVNNNTNDINPDASNIVAINTHPVHNPIPNPGLTFIDQNLINMQTHVAAGQIVFPARTLSENALNHIPNNIGYSTPIAPSTSTTQDIVNYNRSMLSYPATLNSQAFYSSAPNLTVPIIHTQDSRVQSFVTADFGNISINMKGGQNIPIPGMSLAPLSSVLPTMPIHNIVGIVSNSSDIMRTSDPPTGLLPGVGVYFDASSKQFTTLKSSQH